MTEVIWHGRAGQGAFSAARLLGAAALAHDKVYSLAFPSFGPERRGAPMKAYTKIDEKPIANRAAPEQAKIIVYLDNTLMGDNWTDECFGSASAFGKLNSLGDSLGDMHDFGGGLDVDYIDDYDSDYDDEHPSNKADADPNEIRAKAEARSDAFYHGTSHLFVNGKSAGSYFGEYNSKQLFFVELPASDIAKEVLGKDIVNTVFLGALCEAFDGFCIEDAYKVIEDLMPPSLQEKNKIAAKRGAELLAGLSCEPLIKWEYIEAYALGQDMSQNTNPYDMLNPAVFRERGVRQENLRSNVCREVSKIYTDELDLMRLAQNTCFASGYKNHINAGWRSEKPVFTLDGCTKCLQCYMQCPDGCIIFSDDNLSEEDSAIDAVAPNSGAAHGASDATTADAADSDATTADAADSDATTADAADSTPFITIDYAFCKGCGICAQACKTGALKMQPEHEAD